MKRILLIEDDEVTGRVYRGVLEKDGYEVEVATDGQIGLDRLADFKPDGMMVDLMLPRINGVELIKRIRAMAPAQNLPIVACTNAFVPAMVDQVKAAGADMVLDKATITPSLILASFHELFGRRTPPPRAA